MAFGRLPEALEASDTARKLEPGHERLELIYADVLQRQGDYEKALEVLSPMLEKDEPDFDAVMSFTAFAPGLDLQDKAIALIEKLKQANQLTEQQEENIAKALAWLESQSD
jgi:tetratricopeptide (TPR) repeat protein